MVERFFNGLNVIRGIGFGIVCLVLAVGAFSWGGWFGWISGLVLVAFALYGFVGPVLWPKYHPPET
jgi:hypothetical protein